MDVQYGCTILYVEDVPATLKAYNQAFGFEQKLLTPEKDYGELATGLTTLAFANVELAKSNFYKGFTLSKANEQPFGMEIAFTSSELERVMELGLNNGAELLQEAVTKPWGQTVGLNGFIIEICSPIKE
jgi:uncharacterized glyoxalase superfamily protein PhnB